MKIIQNFNVVERPTNAGTTQSRTTAILDTLTNGQAVDCGSVNAMRSARTTIYTMISRKHLPAAVRSKGTCVWLVPKE